MFTVTHNFLHAGTSAAAKAPFAMSAVGGQMQLVARGS